MLGKSPTCDLIGGGWFLEKNRVLVRLEDRVTCFDPEVCDGIWLDTSEATVSP